MDNEQLEELIREWNTDEPLDASSLASRVRRLRDTRANRRRTAIAASTMASMILALSAAIFRPGESQDSVAKQVVSQSENFKPSDANTDQQLAMQRTQLNEDIEQLRFKLELLSTRIQVQQQITRAQSLTSEIDRLAGLDEQAAAWLFATLQDRTVNRNPK